MSSKTWLDVMHMNLFVLVVEKLKDKSIPVALSNVHANGPSFLSIGMSILKAALHGDIDCPDLCRVVW